MTAPVVADYASEPGPGEAGRMEWRSSIQPADGPDLGRLDGGGAGFGATLVVSIGVTGPYDLPTMRQALGRLELWLFENGGTWQRAGSARRLMYQNPTWRNANRLYSEVEIPIVPVQRPETSRPGRGLLVLTSGHSRAAGLFGDRAVRRVSSRVRSHDPGESKNP